MKELFGILSFVISIGITIPYLVEIVQGKAKPARSTRVLLLILTSTVLVIQVREFTSWALAFTIAEVITQVLIIALALKYGVGGMERLDKISYGLFAVSIMVYILSTQDILIPSQYATLVGILFLCITDFVGSVPTIVKNYKDPDSDSPLFFGVDTIASFFGILAASNLTNMEEILYPAFLTAVNIIVFVPLMKGKNAGRFQIKSRTS